MQIHECDSVIRHWLGLVDSWWMLRRYAQQSSPWLRVQLRCSLGLISGKWYVPHPHQGKSRHSSHSLAAAGTPSGGPHHKKLGTLSDTRASVLDTWQHPSSGPNLCISFRERRCPCSMLRTGSNEGSGIGGKANRVYNVRMLNLLTKALKLAAKAEPAKPASCTIDAQVN
ncbi:hypothetical protein LZ32DRAFT_100309 [Colletotrichum eremochloae]|nr:hypothetical protein LZ32DRAFT_100309 [Colletotrichum eremochloae]